MPFEGFGLHPQLVKAIRALGYTRPTPIQAEVIPAGLGGRDLIGSAPTGTGKTAAFLLPILQRMITGTPVGKTRVLVMVPTRELAVQVEENLRSLAKHASVRSMAIYGGVGMEPQVQALRSGVAVVLATPGRLLDHLRRGNARLDSLEVLILDEADRMLDMGFLPDIRNIIKTIPWQRQTMLFSATMSSEILQLAREILHNPLKFKVGGKEKTAVGIRHAAYPVAQHLKTELLLTLLRELAMPSVLVFTRTRNRADRLARMLERDGFKTGRLHASRTQSQRLAALKAFQRGHLQVLVATDLAARGIDVEKISHVINFDIPNTPEDYIHRVGRTARMEALGDAFTLVSPEEEKTLRLIEQSLGPALPRITLPDFNYRAMHLAKNTPGAPADGHKKKGRFLDQPLRDAKRRENRRTRSKRPH
ncbi:MAG: DEAD/DEAH box helicase [Acidobacteria bacterium]|nr:DEAD/DEAH box helicase [Acidobacteriota bacterium]MBI3657579.1 DEAD/DEAH box helicase [Acidobacteriota bacterium]